MDQHGKIYIFTGPHSSNPRSWLWFSNKKLLEMPPCISKLTGTHRTMVKSSWTGVNGTWWVHEGGSDKKKGWTCGRSEGSWEGRRWREQDDKDSWSLQKTLSARNPQHYAHSQRRSNTHAAASTNSHTHTHDTANITTLNTPWTLDTNTSLRQQT